MNKTFNELLRQTVAYLTLSGLLFSTFGFAGNAQSMSKPKTASAAVSTKSKKLTEDQKIIHVLNRLAFGARPGDIEKVKQIGLDKYIEQQLDPATIDDSATAAKLKNFDVLKLSTEEIFAKYPNPGGILNILRQQNGLTNEQFAQLRTAKNASKADLPTTDGTMTKAGEAMKPAGDVADEREEYRQQIADIYQKYDFRRPQEITRQLNASRVIRAVYSEKQLNEVMVDFWSNHFNVYVGKNAVRWMLPSYDRDVIRPNALGNFKDLLTATAKSPAMLFYLDNFQSVAPQEQNPRLGKLAQAVKDGQLTPQMRERIKQQQNITDEELDARIAKLKNAGQKAAGRGINENYAREVMELHTLGVNGGYSQQDIKEVARCFTGWTIVDPRGYRGIAAKMIAGDEQKRGKRLAKVTGIPEDAAAGTFYFNEKAHDKGEKIVMGQKINEGGIKDGEKVIDILVKSPATAKFIARKLAVKFVNDNPSEAFVNRIAAAFSKSNGDIKLTLRAIFTDDEFYAPENYKAKIKTPFEVTVSAIRAIGADTNGGQIQAMLNKMGEQLYGWQAPTGYPDTAEDWVNTGALLERMNFAIALSSNRIPGTKTDLAQFLNGHDPDDKNIVLDKFLNLILHGEVLPNTKASLQKQLNQPLPEPSVGKIEADTETENPAMDRRKIRRQR